MGLKSRAVSLFTRDLFVPLWRPVVSDLVIVMMMHRFAHPDRGVSGHSIADLRANLEFLRRHRYHVAGLSQFLATAGKESREDGRPTVVFTVDDGYADFVEVAAPVFAEFDCPVTVFLVTGPLDGPAWFWWDRVAYAVSETTRNGISIDAGGPARRWEWHDAAARADATTAITELLKTLSNDAKVVTIAQIAERLEVEFPERPPRRYEAMTWDDVTALGERGVTFGPHSVTHPMFDGIPDSRAVEEVRQSWARLSAKTSHAVPVFCYPSGSFSARDVRIVQECGMQAAVTTIPHYARRGAFTSSDPNVRFGVPRFAYPETRAGFVQVASGFERLKMAFRDGSHGWTPIGA